MDNDPQTSAIAQLHDRHAHPFQPLLESTSCRDLRSEASRSIAKVSLTDADFAEGAGTSWYDDYGLRNDTLYVTSWLSAGWTNDVMTIGNLIYLALITSRVPVLPPFTSHIGGSSVPIAFSEIFDIQRLSIALNLPILEWHQIKDIELAESLKEQDELGCWNIWEVDNIHSGGPRGSYSALILDLVCAQDISYTRAPRWVKLIPGFEHDSHSTFWSLARLAFPGTRNDVLADPVAHPTRPSEQHGAVIPPDEQMLCYDYLYYVCGNQPFEYEYDYSPAWRFVVQHFRWTSQLENLALGYVRRTLRIPDGQAIPPYITIHARRGDFTEWCGDIPVEDCFAPLSAFARRVAEVQQDLRERHGIEVSHVIMTGDEKDESWWDAVHELGWSRIDHNAERTVQLHGKWYPVILDAVIQSLGMGFVGTDRSTFSILARRRVVDWNDGAIRTVKWGRPDSDAH
ncbi:hypothetical protein WOLCODRAFT_129563 [Wolfiporia cocos MD-104 SS10]|uniref:Uncharacterized protein n=1 Tax=Wolfiporia cocos (strain MD-104) TaxID=742152 RepID=A0A2H3ISR5_WOLCO|nr:hypothetical protein WOLCODRAFT_129563 [Wolfiporia cocos MD-104 SS10]